MYRPLGVCDASFELLRQTSGSSLTVVRSCFYPKERFTLEPTNMIQFSKYWDKYSILTCKLSSRILLSWTEKQPRCGLARKTWKISRRFGNCTDASPIRRLFGLLSEWWHEANNPNGNHPTQAPNKERRFHPHGWKPGAFSGGVR